MKLFDSSAIMNLCGNKKTCGLIEGRILELAFHESGNAVWKQIKSKSISAKEGDIVLAALVSVIQRWAGYWLKTLLAF
jgi:predicted nucleic acid-binding protein